MEAVVNTLSISLWLKGETKSEVLLKCRNEWENKYWGLICNYTCQALRSPSVLHCGISESVVWGGGVISLGMVKGFWTPDNSAHPNTYTQRKSKSNSQWNTGISGNTWSTDISWQHCDHVAEHRKGMPSTPLVYFASGNKIFQMPHAEFKTVVYLYRVFYCPYNFLTIIKTQWSNYKKNLGFSYY